MVTENIVADFDSIGFFAILATCDYELYTQENVPEM